MPVPTSCKDGVSYLFDEAHAKTQKSQMLALLETMPYSLLKRSGGVPELSGAGRVIAVNVSRLMFVDARRGIGGCYVAAGAFGCVDSTYTWDRQHRGCSGEPLDAVRTKSSRGRTRARESRCSHRQDIWALWGGFFFLAERGEELLQAAS